MWNETKELKGETRGQVNLLGFVCREDMAKQGKWVHCFGCGSYKASLFARGKN